MKIRYLLSVLLMLPIGLFATGNVHSHKDNLDKRFITSPVKPDYNYQSQLRNEPSWKQFTAINGDWWVQFNESNGLPHRAMGKPISIPVTSSPEQAASYFLHNMAGMFLPDNINLKFVGSTTNNKHYQPNFIQYYQGKEVLFSRGTVKMSKNYKAIMFGLDVYGDIQLPNKEMINAESAASAASSDVDHVTKININPDLKILPVPSYRNNIYHLVYEVTVSTLEENIPALYYTLVDANTGDILYRQNKINHINTDVTMSGTVYPTNVYNPSQVKPLQYVRMNIGGVNYNADVNGQFQNIVLPASISATFYLEGPWAKVYTGASGSTLSTMTSTLNIGTNTLSFDNNTNIRHRSAYYHTNIVHDFMKSKLSFFTDLDFPMIVKVDRTDGTCNAFYDGNLNFYTTAGGCNALSQVDDVIYHEYGHGITNVFWASNGLNFSNGAMGEGYSDIWAISITGNPVLGIGFDDTDPTVYIRNYDFNNGVPRKIYPQNIVGQVHSDGEIIAGAWYTLALNLNSLSQMADLFAATHSGLANGPDGAEGQVYTDILIDA